MTILSSETLHASCVAIHGRAVLIEGLSGSGKSDLALRLIDRGALLVSDDYTLAKRSGKQLIADAPLTILGKIEIRGLGIVDMVPARDVPVALVVALGEPVERLPDEARARTIAGIALPLIVLDAREPSAPIKVERALAAIA
ncbi:MAG: aldolase [Sphingomonadaceae bacterium]|nr:aldolase [Sphingomonadaceae bacterium]